MSTSYQNIRVENKDGVSFLVFNRPAKKNALSPEMHLEIFDALTKLSQDSSCRVLVLTGEGDKLLCRSGILGNFSKKITITPLSTKSLGD